MLGFYPLSSNPLSSTGISQANFECSVNSNCSVVTADLTTNPKFSASLSCQSTTTAVLTTSINNAASVTCVCTVVPVITTTIVLAATVTCTTTVSTITLNSQINLAASAASLATSGADLATSIKVVTAIAAISSVVSASLTTQINLNSLVSSVTSSTSNLNTSLVLSANVLKTAENQLLKNSIFSGTVGQSNYPTGWTNTGSNSSNVTLNAQETVAGYLTQPVSIRRIGVSGFEGLQQSVFVKNATTYTLSAYIRVPTGVTSSDALVYFANAFPGLATLATAATLNAQPKDTWVLYSTTVSFTFNQSQQFSIINPSSATGQGFDVALPMIFEGTVAQAFIPTTGFAVLPNGIEGRLSTSIRTAGSISDISTASGSLSSNIQLAGSLTSTTTASSSLSTTISLNSQITAVSSVSAVLTTVVNLQSSVTSLVTSTAVLSTNIQLLYDNLPTTNLITNPIPNGTTSGYTAAGGTGTVTYDSANSAIRWVRDTYEVWGAYLNIDPGFTQGSIDINAQYNIRFKWKSTSQFPDTAFAYQVVQGVGIDATVTVNPILTYSTLLPDGWYQFDYKFNPVNSGIGTAYNRIIVGPYGTNILDFEIKQVVFGKTLTSVASGAISTQIPLSATSAATSTTTASLTTNISVTSTATAVSTATAALSTAIVLSLQAFAVVSNSATLNTGITLAGTALNVASSNAALSTAINVAGATTSISNTTAALSTQISLAGTVTNVTTTTGTLSTSIRLATTATANSSVIVDLTTTVIGRNSIINVRVLDNRILIKYEYNDCYIVTEPQDILIKSDVTESTVSILEPILIKYDYSTACIKDPDNNILIKTKTE